MKIEWSENGLRVLVSRVHDGLLFEKCKVVPLGASEKEREGYVNKANAEIQSDIDFENRIKGARSEPALIYQKLGNI